MHKINFKEQILPHLITVVLFLLVTIAFFKPVFLDNKALNQHDILQWQGGAQEILDYRKAHGEEALWTNSMFGGMPGYLISTKWGIGVISTVQAVISFGLPHPVKVVFLLFLGFYILLLTFGVRPYIAIAGALAFGLSSFNIIGIGAGHNARIAAIAYMPLVLAGIRLTFNKSLLAGFALTSLGLALELRAAHLQITYYLVLIIAAYLMVEGVSAFKKKQFLPYIKTGAVLFMAATLAFGTFIGSIMSTLEYTQYSIRGKSELTKVDNEPTSGLEKDYAFQYSNGIFEPMTLMIPNILGGATSDYLFLDEGSQTRKALQRAPNPEEANQLAQYSRAYWGDQPNTAPYYAGAIVCFLFVLGLMLIDKKTLAWSIPMIILGIVLSWGSNFSSFNYFMFDYFPGYNKFRSVTFAIIISILLINLLGFIGLEKLFQKGENKETKRQLLIAFGATAGLSLLLAIFAGVFRFESPLDSQLPAWLTNAFATDRQALLQGDAFRTFAFILLAAGVILGALKGKLKYSVASLLIVVLVLLDSWTIDKRFLDESKFERNPSRAYFNATEADKLIMQDKDADYRVFNLINPFNDARTSYFHKSIGGYHGAKIRRYQDLIDRCISTEQQNVIASLRSSGILPGTGMGVINMLNTKYFVAGASAQAVIPNTQANGNAWLVKNVQLVNSPDDELDATCKIDTKATAVVDQSKFKLTKTSYSSEGSTELLSYQPNELKYRINVADNAFVVFSEIYYAKGWIATIDGQEAPILRANYVLRALEVPSGKHEIGFTFKPKVYSYGNTITTASSILLILIVLGTLLVELGFIKLKK